MCGLGAADPRLCCSPKCRRRHGAPVRAGLLPGPCSTPCASCRARPAGAAGLFSSPPRAPAWRSGPALLRLSTDFCRLADRSRLRLSATHSCHPCATFLPLPCHFPATRSPLECSWPAGLSAGLSAGFSAGFVRSAPGCHLGAAWPHLDFKSLTASPAPTQHRPRHRHPGAAASPRTHREPADNSPKSRRERAADAPAGTGHTHAAPPARHLLDACF